MCNFLRTCKQNKRDKMAEGKPILVHLWWYGFNELAPVLYVVLPFALRCSLNPWILLAFLILLIPSMWSRTLQLASTWVSVCVDTTGVHAHPLLTENTHMYSAVRAHFGERIHLFCNQSAKPVRHLGSAAAAPSLLPRLSRPFYLLWINMCPPDLAL